MGEKAACRKGCPAMAKKNKGPVSSPADSFLKSPNGRICLLGAILVVITLAAFWGIWSNSFINADDDVYVSDNLRVQSGLTAENIRWAFSTTYFGFYYPLTWLSHMLDCDLFGLWAGGHHITSLAIHLLNTLLLFWFLWRATGREGRSFSVAALFAVHPLHVESVAWVAERKDVLCAFFWFLALLAYLRYIEKPSVPRYSLLFIFFMCGLLSKPMIITLPFTLILLDYWPLKRWAPFGAGRDQTPQVSGRGGAGLSRLLLEKLPLFLLIPVFAMLTFRAQEQAEAVASLKGLALDRRVSNALISYVAYLKKMVFPSDLSAYYPLSESGISTGYAVVCGAFLAAMTALALYLGRKKGYLAAGWLWYLGTLVPVIGVVQIGAQAMADRYTYVPLVGIFVILVWFFSDLAEEIKIRVRISRAIFAATLLILVVLARIQAGYWADSLTLFNRALSITPDNFFAHNAVGNHYLVRGDNEKAVEHFREAVRLDPGYSVAHYNLAMALMNLGMYGEAVGHYEMAMKEKEDAVGMSNLGMALAKLDRREEAALWLRKAIRLNPDCFDARNNLASVLSETGQLVEAEEQYREALRIRPGSPVSLNGLGRVLARAGRWSEAVEQFRKAVQANPENSSARISLGKALAESGETEAAADQFREALKAAPPDDPRTLNEMGLAFAGVGKMRDAAELFRKAVDLAPEVAEARINYGYALLQTGRAGEAAEQFRIALKIDPGSQLARANLEQALGLLREERRGRGGAGAQRLNSMK